MKTLDDLKAVQEKAAKAMSVRGSAHTTSITVAMGECGMAAGARAVVSAVLDELNRQGIWDVAVTVSDCRGVCEQEPLVEVKREGQAPITYGNVTPELARRIVSEHIACGKALSELAVTR